MEIILLFVLFSASSDPELSQKLRTFLSFYRENRELISLLMKKDGTMPVIPPSQNTPIHSEDAGENILDALLARLG